MARFNREPRLIRLRRANGDEGMGRIVEVRAGRADPMRTPAEVALPGEGRVAEAAYESLAGGKRGLWAVLPFLGPAFVASVAYVDPGNFATNVAAGAKFGYMLLWVILVSNLMAMLIQIGRAS